MATRSQGCVVSGPPEPTTAPATVAGDPSAHAGCLAADTTVCLDRQLEGFVLFILSATTLVAAGVHHRCGHYREDFHQASRVQSMEPLPA